MKLEELRQPSEPAARLMSGETGTGAGLRGPVGFHAEGPPRTRVRARRRGPRQRRRPVERRVLLQHPSLEVPELWPRIDAELVDQRAAGVLARSQRARPGDRPGTAPARAARADACAVASAAPVGTRPRSRHDDDPSATAGPSGVRSRPTAAPEPRDLTASDMPVGDVLQRLAPPQPERPLHLLQRGHQLGLARSAASGVKPRTADSNRFAPIAAGSTASE